MKILVALFFSFPWFGAFSKEKSFIDVVYQMSESKNLETPSQVKVSFRREPSFYRVDVKQKIILDKLSLSMKNKSPLTIKYESTNRLILDVKGP